MGLVRRQQQSNLGRTIIPINMVSPRTPAGHFIPFTTSRYEAEMPIATAMIVKLIFMIHPFMISPV